MVHVRYKYMAALYKVQCVTSYLQTILITRIQNTGIIVTTSVDQMMAKGFLKTVYEICKNQKLAPYQVKYQHNRGYGRE